VDHPGETAPSIGESQDGEGLVLLHQASALVNVDLVDLVAALVLLVLPALLEVVDGDLVVDQSLIESLLVQNLTESLPVQNLTESLRVQNLTENHQDQLRLLTEIHQGQLRLLITEVDHS
jgi:hypothetical protein